MYKCRNIFIIKKPRTYRYSNLAYEGRAAYRSSVSKLIKKVPGFFALKSALWRGTPPDTPVSQTRDGLSSAGFSPCALSFRLRLHYYSGNNILPSLLCLTARVSFPTLSEFIVGVAQETELHTVVGLETASLYCRTSANLKTY